MFWVRLVLREMSTFSKSEKWRAKWFIVSSSRSELFAPHLPRWGYEHVVLCWGCLKFDTDSSICVRVEMLAPSCLGKLRRMSDMFSWMEASCVLSQQVNAPKSYVHVLMPRLIFVCMCVSFRHCLCALPVVSSPLSACLSLFDLAGC